MVDALRDRGVDAHLLRGDGQYGVRVPLPGGREAEWDTDGTAGLEAQVVDAIARTDYNEPVAGLRAAAPPPGPALSPEGGLFRRFLDGFRYR